MAIPGYWVGGYARIQRPRRLQYPIGWGTLGYALPASVGAPVRCGSVRCLRSAATAASCSPWVSSRFCASTTCRSRVLLVDDGGYGMLRFDQTVAGEPNRGVDLVRPDFPMLARSFGIECRTTDLSGLRDALDEALGTDGPRIVLLEHNLYPPITVSTTVAAMSAWV